jgi:hypothetical protein
MLAAVEINGGVVDYNAAAGRARMSVPPTLANRYTNAQLDNYHELSGRLPRRLPFTSAAPLRLSLRARASHAAPTGTLGFGFWNEPFSIAGSVLAAPTVVWFFYASPPSDMALVPGVAGRGWKAATLTTGRWPSLLLAPAALGAVLLTRLPGLGRPVMNLARRFVTAHEAPLADVSLDQWHTYELEWRETEARFSVDGQERLRAPAPTKGPLGLVMWVDNQYAIASEEGHFGFGVRPLAEPQWLEVADLRIGV